MAFCFCSITDSLFYENEASVQGGVINYNKYRPLYLETNNFMDNYSPHGT